MIIDSLEDFKGFLRAYHTSTSYIIPIFVERERHSLNNNLSLLYISLEGGDSYILPFDHSEAVFTLNGTHLEALKNDHLKWVISRKDMLHVADLGGMLDANLLSYVTRHRKIDMEGSETPAHLHVHNSLRDALRRAVSGAEVNRLIPLLKHAEACEQQVERLKKSVGECAPLLKDSHDVFALYNTLVTDNLSFIEREGVTVDVDTFVRHFGDAQHRHINYTSKTPRVFTEYNLFTSTGRPSNKWGGVNYAALKKGDGSRKAFVSRYGSDGLLVNIDFESYHLRLIGSIVGYDFPPHVRVHEYLARYYHRDREAPVTAKEIEDSKAKTFTYLYGKIPDEVCEDVPFFAAVRSFIEKMWSQFRHEGEIKTPLFGRYLRRGDIQSPNPAKVFNYVLQAVEFERTMFAIERLRDLFERSEWNIHCVLYTYDALLFDVHSDDAYAIKQVAEALSGGGIFPVRVEVGTSYDDLISV